MRDVAAVDASADASADGARFDDGGGDASAGRPSSTCDSLGVTARAANAAETCASVATRSASPPVVVASCCSCCSASDAVDVAADGLSELAVAFGISLLPIINACSTFIRLDLTNQSA